MKEPLVSIIMPAYNAEKYIEESIKSVCDQTYENWELLIIDDCSKDNTLQIVQKFSKVDERIKCLNQITNSGVAKARNRGLKESRGEYIAFLDSDDLWEKEKLEKQIKFMEDKKINFSFTNYTSISEKGKFIKKTICPEKLNYEEALKGNKIGCLTVIIRKSSLKNIIMPELRHEDYATWLQVLRDGNTAYCLQDFLARYRMRSRSLSSNKFKVLFWTFPIYYKQENLGFFKSCYCLICHLAQAAKNY